MFSFTANDLTAWLWSEPDFILSWREEKKYVTGFVSDRCRERKKYDLGTTVSTMVKKWTNLSYNSWQNCYGNNSFSILRTSCLKSKLFMHKSKAWTNAS